MNTIELHDISKSFGNKQVLNKISLQVKEGEILGLLGPSGAGKTTLLNILTGQHKQDEGSSSLMGCDSQQLNDEVYKNIGLVLDNCGLYERLSVYDNLLIFANINDVDKGAIEHVLQRVGLEAEIKKQTSKLSKGMKQRLVFARAILHHPKVLFLDEPTSGLDPATALTIHAIIKELQQAGTTIFLTTHNMEEAMKLCDEVALLNEGVIVEQGSPKALCQKYNDKNTIHIQVKNGDTMQCLNDANHAHIIADLMKQEQIVSIHSSEPSLEDVFIARTGRGLS